MRYVPAYSGDLNAEVRRVQQALENLTAPFVILEVQNVAPVKPVAGMVVLADGVNWNPGAGAGFYGYHSGAWNLLG